MGIEDECEECGKVTKVWDADGWAREMTAKS
jgi:hypothetical protein